MIQRRADKLLIQVAVSPKLRALIDGRANQEGQYKETLYCAAVQNLLDEISRNPRPFLATYVAPDRLRLDMWLPKTLVIQARRAAQQHNITNRALFYTALVYYFNYEDN